MRVLFRAVAQKPPKAPRKEEQEGRLEMKAMLHGLVRKAPVVVCLLVLAGLAAVAVEVVPTQYREVFGYYLMVLIIGIPIGFGVVGFVEWLFPDENSEEARGFAFALGVVTFAILATVNLTGARLGRELAPARIAYQDGNVYAFTTWRETGLGRWVAYQRNETTGEEIIGLMPKTLLAVYSETNEVSFDPRTGESCGVVKSKNRGRLQRCLEGEWWLRLPRPQRGDEFFFPDVAHWMRAKGRERVSSL